MLIRRKPTKKMVGYRLDPADIEKIRELRAMARKEFRGADYGVVTQTDVIRACVAFALKTAKKRGIRSIFTC